MGLEIGWYLRLSRARRLEFLTRTDARGVLFDQLATVSGWRLDVVENPDHLVGVFTRAPA
ncbi:hypothetical protein GD604_15735 [Desulfolutivibrio sulfoxidireducens]|nr:hypothetical protein GD605_16030 [Desulfolutivibrio sulfoxidireducens]QLA21702.1 hypothetical protein GD604_15735 [Desulfolutivibrio sulfoxidireducens]